MKISHRFQSCRNVRGRVPGTLLFPATLAILVFFTALLPSGIALAECQCPKTLTVDESLRESTVALIGSVEDIKKSALKPGYDEVKVHVIRRLKGFADIEADYVIIYNKPNLEECGVAFAQGQDYVVFASGPPAGLKTSACAGTNFLDVMRNHIDRLMNQAEPIKRRTTDVDVSSGRNTMPEPQPQAPAKAPVDPNEAALQELLGTR